MSCHTDDTDERHDMPSWLDWFIYNVVNAYYMIGYQG